MTKFLNLSYLNTELKKECNEMMARAHACSPQRWFLADTHTHTHTCSHGGNNRTSSSPPIITYVPYNNILVYISSIQMLLLISIHYGF